MSDAFRKIRRKLLEENKFTRFVGVAFVEMLLIIVGILLALQLNTWKEKRVDIQKMNLELKALVEALQEDRKELAKVELVSMFRVHALRYLLEYSGETSWLSMNKAEMVPFRESHYWQKSLPEKLDREFIEQAFLVSANYGSMYSNTNVIDEMRSIGLYSSFENQELKALINKYYRELGWRLLTDESPVRLAVDWDKLLIEIGVTSQNIADVQDPISILIDSPKATALLKRIVLDSNWRARSADELIIQIDRIIDMIELEIAK